MNKTDFIKSIFFASIVSLSACNNDTEETPSKECEIKLTSEITPASRVTSLEYQSTQIVKYQQVGVTITGAKNDHKNVAWLVGDNGSLTNTGDAMYYGENKATITAYHPYYSTWSGTNHEFSVSTDQSGLTDYLNSDLLWATTSSYKTESAIPLVFSHKLAKINVTLVPEKIDDNLRGATISIYNTKVSTTFNPATGEISDAKGNTQEIIAGTTPADAYTASAIVIPQTVSGKFIKIALGSKTYYYTLNSAKTLESGHSYSYTLTIKSNQLINTESSIEPWVDEKKEGDAEEEISAIPNNEIWYASTQEITSFEDGIFGANIISNEYKDGYGIIKFDGNVTSIGESAFSNCHKLRSIRIPNSVTTIKTSAFHGCFNLKNITIPNNVTTIENFAFYGCHEFTSISIPKSVTSIGVAAFQACNSLASISVEETNSVYDSRNNCNAIIEKETNTLISSCKNTVIPNNVTSIGTLAFLETPLTSITIPNSVTSIGDYAFMTCIYLTTIHIKATTPPTLGTEVLSECSSDLKIYVPAESYDVYKAADNWKDLNIWPDNQ